jgi:hypothetical protein
MASIFAVPEKPAKKRNPQARAAVSVVTIWLRFLTRRLRGVDPAGETTGSARGRNPCTVPPPRSGRDVKIPTRQLLTSRCDQLSSVARLYTVWYACPNLLRRRDSPPHRPFAPGQRQRFRCRIGRSAMRAEEEGTRGGISAERGDTRFSACRGERAEARAPRVGSSVIDPCHRAPAAPDPPHAHRAPAGRPRPASPPGPLPARPWRPRD